MYRTTCFLRRRKSEQVGNNFMMIGPYDKATSPRFGDTRPQSTIRRWVRSFFPEYISLADWRNIQSYPLRYPLFAFSRGSTRVWEICSPVSDAPWSGTHHSHRRRQLSAASHRLPLLLLLLLQNLLDQPSVYVNGLFSSGCLFRRLPTFQGTSRFIFFSTTYLQYYSKEKERTLVDFPWPHPAPLLVLASLYQRSWKLGN